MSNQARKERIRAAFRTLLAQSPIYLDTETTGLDINSEIVDIAILDSDGTPLLDTLVRPTCSIPADVTAVHGITDTDVANAPTFGELLPALRDILECRALVIYNAAYDTRLIEQSCFLNGHRLRFATFATARIECAMLDYASFYGEIGKYGNYRWQSLANAARQQGLAIPDDLHRARADAELTRQLVIKVAGA